jgi:hypothetical protein
MDLLHRTSLLKYYFIANVLSEKVQTLIIVLHNRGISYLLTDHRSGVFFRAVYRRYSIHDALSIRGISGRALGRRAAAVRNDESHLTGSNALQSLMSTPPLARNERTDSSFREVTILNGSGPSRFAQVWIHRQARGALFVAPIRCHDPTMNPNRNVGTPPRCAPATHKTTSQRCGVVQFANPGIVPSPQYHCQQTRNSFCVRTPLDIHPLAGRSF